MNDQNKSKKTFRPEARLPKGFRDYAGEELRQTTRMLAIIREVYERYGYEPLETPAFEYTEALGKFLPDQDRPNAGVFSLQDEDEQWMSLRYDMTAPLARYVAENKQTIPTPYRRYTMGPVWRNEKPGPGRFRQFMQCDADTVGTENVAADAEACMLMADVIEALGIKRGQYRIKFSSRKLLDGVLEIIGVDPVSDKATQQRAAILRSLDKMDKFEWPDIQLLLGHGRRDPSGDFTPGAGLSELQISTLMTFVSGRFAGVPKSKEYPEDAAFADDMRLTSDLVSDEGYQRVDCRAMLSLWEQWRAKSDVLAHALDDLAQINNLVRQAGYGTRRIILDPSVVRGLDYYTGPVFEAELTFDVKNDDGETVRFGSVGGGGRYDDLVARFTGQRVPATGFSLGLSRLQSALAIINKGQAEPLGPVVVLVMDKAEQPRYQAMASKLRQAGIRAEMYLGSAGMKAQMKYADKRHAPCVVIQGSDERAKGEIQLKDLIEGAIAAAAIKDNKEWKATRPAQFSVPEDNLVAAVHDILARHQA